MIHTDNYDKISFIQSKIVDFIDKEYENEEFEHVMTAMAQSITHLIKTFPIEMHHKIK